MSPSVRSQAMGLGLALLWGLQSPIEGRAQGLYAGHEVFVNSELERYLRTLQIGGEVTPYPWSIRSFAPHEVAWLAPRNRHPWASRFTFGRDSGPGAAVVHPVRPTVRAFVNSTFPYGQNDGAVWAGRGATVAVEAGLTALYGPLTLSIAPSALIAQNAGFGLQDNGRPGDFRFADGRFPTSVDRPQRFGDDAYARLDPGQSTLRLDIALATVGVSTANEHWGPALEQPILLGNNAGGFPHAFAGTSRPLTLGPIRVHGRVLWGRLTHSRYLASSDSFRVRLASGVIGVITPRALPGLELGAARFFHVTWPHGGLSLRDLAKPFESILKVGLPPNPTIPAPRSDPDNQLASAFVRWVLPRGGFEVYAEYGRDDHSWDLRDLMQEPDHEAGYVVGFGKVWRSDPGQLLAVRGELLNLQVSTLIQARSQSPFYLHTYLVPGHTYQGQLLGAAAGLGGAASVLAVDRYHQHGRWGLFWRRELRQDRGEYWRTGIVDPRGLDVLHSVGGDALLFRGPWELGAGVALQYEFNRHLASDATNLSAFLLVRRALSGQRAQSVATSPTEITPETQDSFAPAWRIDVSDVNGSEIDRVRLDQLSGVLSLDGLLLRSAAALPPLPGERRRVRWAPISPRVGSVWNSQLPFSLNDGALWAGRGYNYRALAGLRAEWGPISVVLAPEVVASENRPFVEPDSALTPVRPATRSPFSSPWHVGPHSADIPLRFGNGGFSRLTPGQTSVTATLGSVSIGVGTDDQWWGPGIRNAIVLSNNADGIARAFARTSRPLTTGLGWVEAVWFTGELLESPYFDTLRANDRRSISAAAFTLRLRWEPGLTLGLARAVYAPLSSWSRLPLRALDAFSNAGRPNDRAPSDSSQIPGPDQVYSLFARWALPGDRFETYVEWARTELPRSIRDFLVAPDHTQGYTLGLQWTTPLGQGRTPLIRVQAEHTYLDRSTTFRDRPTGGYYTSRAVIQGYTNRGQVLGASIGPGGSSHWLAVDVVGPDWSAGVFGGRIRWENDALYTTPVLTSATNKWCSHDVSLFTGLRGAARGPWGRAEVELATGNRLNVHFRNLSLCRPDDDPSKVVDVWNTTVAIKYEVPFSRRPPSRS